MKTAEQTNTARPDGSLVVDISDALSERDRVRFTVHTKTKLPQFAKPDMSVVRQHEEFVWLHDCLVDNDEYAGYIIPPVPPKPDFDASRERLQQLGDKESQMTKDEFAKTKQELEAEYLAIFKKTVAMHEIFLQRLAAHDKFRLDPNFKIFLEYENELSVRSKSTKEKLAGSIQNIGKSLTDFVITTTHDDPIDERYFEKERLFLALYYNSIRETAIQADRVTQVQKCVATCYLNLAQNLIKLAGIEVVPIAPTTTNTLATSGAGLKQTLLRLSDYFEQAKKIETRIASDEDLKLTDTFVYYKHDTVAAQDLLMRRLRFMADYEQATRNLEKARQKGGTQMQYADVIQKQARENFVNISKLAKQELEEYKRRRVAAFKKSFRDLAELQLKHLRAHAQLIGSCLDSCRGQ